MLTFTARRQQENVRRDVPCVYRDKSYKTNIRSLVQKFCMKHRILIPGVVHEITGRESVTIGEKQKNKNLKKGSVYSRRR